MEPCKEVRELRNGKYQEFLAYIERKILNNLSDGYIHINEDEAIDNGVSFKEGRWMDLIEDAGYKVEYCNNFVTPTIEISGW